MTLVGLTSLLVGGIGVANGVRAWLEARARTIATLRCLGASSAPGVRGVPDPGAGAGRWPASCIGLVAGSLAPPAAGRRLLKRRAAGAAGSGPLPRSARRSPRAFGLLTALAFSLWPLGRAARIPGGALFRDALMPERTRPSPRLLAANAAVARGLIALTIATAADRRFRAVVLRRALGTLVAVPSRRHGRDAGGPRRPPVGSQPVRLGLRQPAPAGRCHAAACWCPSASASPPWPPSR